MTRHQTLGARHPVCRGQSDRHLCVHRPPHPPLARLPSGHRGPEDPRVPRVSVAQASTRGVQVRGSTRHMREACSALSAGPERSWGLGGQGFLSLGEGGSTPFWVLSDSGLSHQPPGSSQRDKDTGPVIIRDRRLRELDALTAFLLRPGLPYATSRLASGTLRPQ